jgi:hypothetical protein
VHGIYLVSLLDCLAYANSFQLKSAMSTGERYQFVIPTQLNMPKFKAAMLKLAQTEDEQCCLHPEYLVATMSYAQTKEWQARLHEMDEDRRCADRDLLLS